MNDHLKLFANHSAYSAVESLLIKSNVSYCVTEGDVHYNPIPDYSKEYLTFVAKGSGTFTFTPQNSNVISYSTDNGTTWTEGNSIEVSNGDKVMWKGEMTPPSYDGIGRFSATGNFDVQGNVMSLLFGDNYKEQTDLTGKDYVFYQLFNGNTKIVNVENLSLPAETLANYCYSAMFQGCTSLVNAPELPAETLVDSCYSYMFTGCTSLTTAPALPATTLASWCYGFMFNGCISLTTAPELPATILADRCYQYMFGNTNILPDCSNIDFTSETVVSSGGLRGLFGGTKITDADLERILPKNINEKYYLPVTTLADSCYNLMFRDCTSLVTAPELPATTLASSCYSYMFTGCTSLVNAPELPAITLINRCYESMFEGCTSLTTAPQLSATTLAAYCYSSMFKGCTSLTTAPSILPATTLTNSCYISMFNGCTNLTIAPQLPATSLATTCYSSMFKGCTSLNYIKAMFTTTPSTSYTRNWVNGVSTIGTFVKNSAAQWNATGPNAVPTGWTVETESV